jgi:gag-polypeptide of LTR copia-type
MARPFIINSIPATLTQTIGGLATPEEMWNAVIKDREGKTQVDTRKRLQSMQCIEGQDVLSHLSEMTKCRNELAGMGAPVADDDFTAMILHQQNPVFWCKY